jgi:hypothetical protein
VLVLAGCADPEPSASPSTTPSVSATSASPSPSPSPSPSSSPGSPGSGEGYSLDDASSPTFPDLGGELGTQGKVRVGRHDGFVRVVWEFPGAGVPSYQVRYVDEPLGDGSGDPVEVAGDAYLEVLVSRLDIPESVDACPDDASTSMLEGTGLAQANAFCGGFEGVGQGFVGLDEQRPFKVSTLTGPTRLVLDISTG